jgi:DNA-binding CsgD family transcriptional regulator
MNSEDKETDLEDKETDLSEYASVEHLAHQRSGPGVIMLSLPLRVLHMNRKAWELIREINHTENGITNGLLPPVLTEVCAEIQKDLQIRTGAKDWEQFEIRRLAGNPKEPVLFRVFGLPEEGKKGTRIFAIMEKIGRRKEPSNGSNGSNGQAKERFHFTAREDEVCEHLSKGLTNKEIASSLGITEPTVKAHIRNIMEKTRSTTRTGIVSQVFVAASTKAG